MADLPPLAMPFVVVAYIAGAASLWEYALHLKDKLRPTVGKKGKNR